MLDDSKANLGDYTDMHEQLNIQYWPIKKTAILSDNHFVNDIP